MTPTRLRQIVLVVALTGAALAAGCGGGGGSTPTAGVEPEPLPSYLARYPREQPTAVYFIQWQRSGNSVAGTLTAVYPTAVDTPTTTQPITGEIDGQRFSLDVGTDAPQRWTGERAGQTILFRVELGDGPAQTLTFVPAKLAAYKRAVAELRSRR